jgi:hypothetical protein
MNDERPAVTRLEKAAEAALRSQGRRRFRLNFEVDVLDEDELLAYADRRVRACWQSTLKAMTSYDEEKVERALIEALLYSNENPSPDEYGIEFNGVMEIQEVTA